MGESPLVFKKLSHPELISQDYPLSSVPQTSEECA